MNLFGKNQLRASQGGSILIAILGMVAVLSVFVVAVNRQVGQEMVFGRWLMERRLSLELAKAGVQRMLYELQNDKFEAFDANNESWASNEKNFKENKLGEGDFSVICGDQPGRTDAEQAFRYGACDEASRLSLNSATLDELKNLWRAVAGGDIDEKAIVSLAESIIDWRDADDTAFFSGAEANHYKALSRPYDIRNGNFESVEELLMVRGVSHDLFEKIKPFVTVYTDGKVNFNTAPAEVLQGLGLGPGLSEKVIEFRKGLDRKEGTKDDEIFQHVEGIPPAISAAVPFSPEEFAQMANVISSGNVVVRSDLYRIYSTGRLIRGNRVSETRVTAVVDRKGSILYWSEK